jgi:Domain of unknown function (DUF4781)
MSTVVQRPQDPEKPPPAITFGAAPLTPASFFQAPAIPFQAPAFPFQAPAPPLQTAGATHDAIAPATPPQPAQQTTAAPADTVSDAEGNRVDAWLSNNDHLTSGDLCDALKGLSKPGQRYLISCALDRLGVSGSRDLAQRLQGDADLRGVVAAALLNRAIGLEDRSEGGNGALDTDNPHNYARGYALDALIAMRGDDQGLGQLLSSMPPKRAELFARALGMADEPGLLAEERNQVLNALNRVPQTKATSAVVQNLYVQTSPDDIARTPRLADSLARALTREWYPDRAATAAPEVKQHNEEARHKEGSRLKNLMETSQGARLLFGGSQVWKQDVLCAVRRFPLITAQTLAYYRDNPAKWPVITRALAYVLVPADTPDRDAAIERLSDILQTDQGRKFRYGALGSNLPEKAGAAALQLLLSDPSITAATLKQTDDPWTNPVLVEPIAQANDVDYRRDEPAAFTEAELDKAVGRAMGPNMPSSMPSDPKDQPAWLRWHSGVQKVVKQILKTGGQSPWVTCLPVTFSSGDCGPIQLALFRVETPLGSRFVDHAGRFYQNFEEWKKTNKLPSGLMIYPEEGHLRTDRNGKLKLANGPTPESGHTASKIVDYAALVGGIIAGGAVILGTGGMGIALLAVGSAAWSGYHNYYSELKDRHKHRQSNSFSDPEARGLYFGLAASATGVGAFASEAALASMIARGSRLAGIAAFAIGTMRVGATITNGAAFLNECVETIGNWESMTPDQRATAVAQMGFWALTSAVGARQARSFGELCNPIKAARAVYDAYQPTVRLDLELEGNRVEIRTEQGRQVIYKGPKATDDLVKLHILIVRLMARERGLSGLIQFLRGEPLPGSPAHRFKWEKIKLRMLLEETKAKLDGGGLTDPQIKDIERAVGIVEDELALIEAREDSNLDHLAHPGEEAIASPNTSGDPPGGSGPPGHPTAAPVNPDNGELIDINANGQHHSPKMDRKPANKPAEPTRLPTAPWPATKSPPAPPRRGPVSQQEFNRLELAARQALDVAVAAANTGKGKIPGQALNKAAEAIGQLEQALRVGEPEASPKDRLLAVDRLRREYASLPDEANITARLNMARDSIARDGFAQDSSRNAGHQPDATPDETPPHPAAPVENEHPAAPAESETLRISREIARLTNEIGKTYDQIAALEANRLAPYISTPEQNRIAAEIERLEGVVASKQAGIERLGNDLDDARTRARASSNTPTEPKQTPVRWTEARALVKAMLGSRELAGLIPDPLRATFNQRWQSWIKHRIANNFTDVSVHDFSNTIYREASEIPALRGRPATDIGDFVQRQVDALKLGPNDRLPLSVIDAVLAE